MATTLTSAPPLTQLHTSTSSPSNNGAHPDPALEIVYPRYCCFQRCRARPVPRSQRAVRIFPENKTNWRRGFLNHEYQDHDKDMRTVERHQPKYDEPWKELVDSQVLRPSETEEFICNIKFQHASEKERAEKAVESAKSAVMSAQNAIPGPRRAHLSQ